MKVGWRSYRILPLFFENQFKFFYMGGFGMAEILLILGIVLLLFGAKKIPELMRGIGKGMREFTDAREDPAKTEKDRVSETTDPVVPPRTTRDRI